MQYINIAVWYVEYFKFLKFSGHKQHPIALQFYKQIWPTKEFP